MSLRQILPAIAAAAFMFAGSAHADLKKDWIEYSHGSTKLKGYVVHDAGINAKRPAVLMVHSKSGMTKTAEKQAETWAGFGYVVFAADMFGFGEGVLPKDAKEQSAQTSIYRKDRPLARTRAQAGWDALVRHPLVDGSKIALIGYCFGGDIGVEFGTTGAPLLLNVSIHGSFSKSYEAGWANNIKGRFLILHGAEDVNYPLTTVATIVDALRGAKVPFQLEVYSGAGHGFSTPRSPDNERANTQSIAATGRALKEVFGL